MPNNFGGDQFHPSYNPSVKLLDNQVEIENRVYTITLVKPNLAKVTFEDVDGYSDLALQPYPQQVQDKIDQLLLKETKEGKHAE